MFSNLFLKVFERMLGRKFAAAVAEESGGIVTERTLRNWLQKRTAPDVEKLAALRDHGRNALIGLLANRGWPAARRDAALALLGTDPGLATICVLVAQGSEDSYPASMQLAREIDELDKQLDDLGAAGDRQRWLDTLLAAPWIDSSHLCDPDADDPCPDSVRRNLREADSWEAMRPSLAIIVANVHMQLLATLDLEFCACSLRAVSATSIFAALLPRVDPSVDYSGMRVIPATRDLFHYPVRRLLDAMACMRVRHIDGSWPNELPQVRDMARWLDFAGQPALASSLVKWRGGRAFAKRQFTATWQACFSKLPESQRPREPMPMMYAASLFTEMFVKGSRETGGFAFIVPEPALYLRWWERQRSALAGVQVPLGFGSEAWMPGLA